MIAIVAGLLSMQASNLLASAFRVTPVQVHLAGKSSTLLTLANESGVPLRFQISAFAWSQSPKGEIGLQPTEDVSFFPALLTLGAGEERKVRVGSNVPAGQVEKTYRIFFEELPAAETSTKQQSEVRILTKMGIPIFIDPLKPAVEARLAGITAEAGALKFQVTNTGNAHFSVQRLNVTGLSASGEKLFQRTLDGWYVLAGGVREYRVEIPAADCPKLASAKIEMSTDISTTPAAANVAAEQSFRPGSACRQ